MWHLFRRQSDGALLDEIIRRQSAERMPGVRLRLRRSLILGVAVILAATTGLHIAIETPAVRSVAAWARAILGDKPPVSDQLTGRPSVIDGDTLDIRGTRIRLWGVDAPESAQLCQRDGQAWQCGRAAANALAEWIGERTAICEQKDIDRYGRIVGRCVVGGTDVSAWLVENGWALAFRRYSLDYVANEDRARGMRSGIWASEFMPPWEWRAARTGLR